eukprot:2077765-Amphidinium_carterae.1
MLPWQSHETVANDGLVIWQSITDSNGICRRLTPLRHGHHRSAYKMKWGGKVYLVKTASDDVGTRRNLQEATAVCSELPTSALWRSKWGKAVLIMRFPRVVRGYASC